MTYVGIENRIENRFSNIHCDAFFDNF